MEVGLAGSVAAVNSNAAFRADVLLGLPTPLAGELAAELRARDPRHALLSGRAANRTRIAHGFAAGGGDAGGRGGLLAERVCCDLSVASQTRVPAGEGSGG